VLLQVLQDGPWKIVSPVEGEGDDMTCALLLRLEELMAAYEGSVNGFYDLLTRIDHIGPRRLGNELYRCVDDKNEIYEFRKGDLRIFSFTFGGAICVCANVGIKKGQKVSKPDLKVAQRIQSQVAAAAGTGTLRYVKIDEEGDLEVMTQAQLLTKK
jgi:hypothetical protein